jgi:hypothetical protein
MNIAENPEILAGKEDLLNLSERDFLRRYSASKRQYKAIVETVEQLFETADALDEQSPLDIDSDVIDDLRYTAENLLKILERMHMASYWESEQE